MRYILLSLILSFALPQDAPIRFARDVESAKDLGLTLDGLRVGEIEKKGIAYKSGIRTGDIIKQISGTDVESWEDVLGAFSEHPLHAALKIQVERKGKTKKLTLKISRIKAAMSLGRGGKTGQRNESIEADGKSRTYIVKAPPQASKGAPLPLVVLLHGDAGTGAGMIDWTPATHREAVILALDGLNKTWSDGSDVAFVLAAIDQALKEYNIDLRRIYALGFSSGAALAFKLGYERGDLFAAVGVYAGMGSKGTPSKRKAAFVLLYGTADSSASLSSAKTTVKDLKEAGYSAELIEEKGLTHDYTQEASKKLWNRVKTHQIK